MGSHSSLDFYFVSIRLMVRCIDLPMIDRFARKWVVDGEGMQGDGWYAWG